MMKPNLSAIVQLMRKSIDRMQRDGSIRPKGNKIVLLKDVFPFRPEDVASVGYAGEDIRFHLGNGRIFDGAGKPVEGAPAKF